MESILKNHKNYGKKTFDKIDISSIPLPDVEALSVEAVDKKFNLKASGSEDGSRCEPRSDAQSQSAFEIKIGAYFSQHMSQIKARFRTGSALVERAARDSEQRLIFKMISIQWNGSARGKYGLGTKVPD